jgi:ABC-type lipoprotein export system ATPase subunit
MITNFLQQNGTIILTTHDKNLFNEKHNVINLDLLKELRAK